jgi:hypothetical protein
MKDIEARIFESLDEPKKAIESWKEALKTSSDFYIIYNILGSLIY